MPQPSPLISIPEDRAARWALLLEVIANWYRPVVTGDGYEEEWLRGSQTRTGIQLPLAMREWYRLVGRMDDVWNRQDTLLQPDKLSLEGGILEFYVESQGVTSWGVREAELSVDDPPVVVRDEEDRWVIQSPRFSEFVLHRFAFSIQFGKHPAQIYGFAQSTFVQRLEDNLPELGLPEFIWTRSRLFGFNDLVVCIDGTNHVSASARTRESINPFRQLISEKDFQIFVEDIDPSANRR